MADKKSVRNLDGKETFWQKYKYLIFGLVGALLLISSMSVQNVVLYYEVEDQERYAVKMDYSAFGTCIRCFGTTDNSKQIVEKAIFTGVGKKESVEKAAKGLKELAGKEGTFYLRAGGLLGNSEKETDQLIEGLQAKGYAVKEISR